MMRALQLLALAAATNACAYGYICGNPSNGCAVQGQVYNCPNEPATTAPTTSAPQGATVPASYAVNLESSAAAGSYLASGTGFTLYTYTKDVPNSGASACYSSCASNWPAFYAPNFTLAPGLNASEFSTITRTGGELQLAYKGWPLYFFAGDGKPGAINGNGVGGFALATR